MSLMETAYLLENGLIKWQTLKDDLIRSNMGRSEVALRRPKKLGLIVLMRLTELRLVRSIFVLALNSNHFIGTRDW